MNAKRMIALAAALVLPVVALAAQDAVTVMHVTVTMPDGSPAAGVEVFCMPQHHRELRTSPPTGAERAVTDEAGKASFSMVDMGTRIVYAWHGNLSAGVTSGSTIDPERTVALSLGNARQVTGRILDHHGDPLGGVYIIAYRGILLGVTDARGQFDIQNMGRVGFGNTVLYKPGHGAHSFDFARNTGSYDIVLPPPDLPVPAAEQDPQDAHAASVEEADGRVPVRIHVRDTAGEPVPNIRLLMQRAPGAVLGISDAEGYIHGWAAWDGTAHWTARRAYAEHRLFFAGTYRSIEARQRLELLSQSLRAEVPDDLLNMHVTIDRDALRVMRGRLADDTAAPVSGRVEVMREGHGLPSPQTRSSNGLFVADELPDTPFALVFTRPGHQARVLAEGIHFERGDEVVAVLPRGPFPAGESVWTAVTGQPATDEAVAAFPSGDSVRARERQFTALAASDEEFPPRPRQPETHAVQVVNAAGEPLREIHVQEFEAHLISGFPLGEARPLFDRRFETLSSADGRYEIAHRSAFVWAEGLGWALVSQLIGPQPEPRIVALHPLRRLTVTVRDHNGAPVSGALVGPATTMQFLALGLGQQARAESRFGVVATGADGRADLGEWPVDFFDFTAVRGDDFQQATRFYAGLTPAGRTDWEVLLPPWPEDSAAAKLDAWKRDRSLRFHAPLGLGVDPMTDAYQEMLEALREHLVSPLTSRERRAVAAELVRRIQSAPSTIQHSNLSYYGTLAAVFEVHEALEPLRDAFSRTVSVSVHGGGPHVAVDPFALVPAVTAIISLGGDDASWFERAAMDAHADALVRTASAVALGRMGGEDSLAAWRRLRAQYDAHPTVPARTAEDTHEDRMAQASAITLFAMADGPGAHAEDRPEISVQGARVDEEYRFGYVTVSLGITSTLGLYLRRVDDEWMVTGFGMRTQI